MKFRIQIDSKRSNNIAAPSNVTSSFELSKNFSNSIRVDRPQDLLCSNTGVSDPKQKLQYIAIWDLASGMENKSKTECVEKYLRRKKCQNF